MGGGRRWAGERAVQSDKRAFPRGLKALSINGTYRRGDPGLKSWDTSRAVSKQVQTAKPRPFKGSTNCEAAPFQSFFPPIVERENILDKCKLYLYPGRGRFDGADGCCVGWARILGGRGRVFPTWRARRPIAIPSSTGAYHG